MGRCGLFQPFDHGLSIRAPLDGLSAGRIFVDAAQPQLAFALTIDSYLLARMQ
jgi:hypothetical protein